MDLPGVPGGQLRLRGRLYGPQGLEQTGLGGPVGSELSAAPHSLCPNSEQGSDFTPRYSRPLSVLFPQTLLGNTVAYPLGVPPE